MRLQDALIDNYGYPLVDGTHPILPEYIDSEFQEAYEGLTETVGLLNFVIADGAVSKAYKATLGTVEGKAYLRNNHVDYPVDYDVVTVCPAFVYINTPEKPDESTLMVDVKVSDLLPLKEGGGGSSGLLKVRSGDIPNGTYYIRDRKLCEAQDRYGTRQFTAVTLVAEKEVKVAGTKWDPEEKCNDMVKETVLEFTTGLPATYSRPSVKYVTMSGFNPKKSGESRPTIGAPPEARFMDNPPF